MQFLYNESASDNDITLFDESFRYIIKARRHKVNDEIYLRNLRDNNIYKYRIVNIGKKEAELSLVDFKEHIIKPNKNLHIGWCNIDTKVVEKILPSLNQIGVDKITFINCDFSQKDFKVNIKRINKILINSSEQCGRSSIMDIDFHKSLESFFTKYPDSFILDFGGDIDFDNSNIKTVVVGCEGGFSNEERMIQEGYKKITLKTPTILKSETAVLSISSKILL